MSKMSLLDMTQNILSAMDSDEVNSINDTVESLQVAEVIKETYYEITANQEIPSNEKLTLLEALSDPARPNYLKIPEEFITVLWIQYDYRTDDVTSYVPIKYLDPVSFIQMTNSQTNSYQEVEDFQGARLHISNVANPTYWTTFDNQYIIFDSFNSSLESTLQNTKSLCLAQVEPTWQMDDTFIPTLDSNLFPLLLSEAKSVCFMNFKQIANSKEEQRAKRQRTRAQNNLWRANQRKPYDRTPDYGRRGPR